MKVISQIVQMTVLSTGQANQQLQIFIKNHVLIIIESEAHSMHVIVVLKIGVAVCSCLFGFSTVHSSCQNNCFNQNKIIIIIIIWMEWMNGDFFGSED